MSTIAVPALTLANLALIGLLPRIFFRKGRLNSAWWVTAGPFIASAVALLMSMAGALAPWRSPTSADEIAAVVLAVGSICLIVATLGSHREPLSLWHQVGDRPSRLVRSGPYAYIRHPFYTAFLATQLSAFFALPHWITAVALVAAFFRLDHTARLEEQNFLSSDLAADYAAYQESTGRFIARPLRRGKPSPFPFQPSPFNLHPHYFNQLPPRPDLHLGKDARKVSTYRARRDAELFPDGLVRLPSCGERGDFSLPG